MDLYFPHSISITLRWNNSIKRYGWQIVVILMMNTDKWAKPWEKILQSDDRLQDQF